ncbi:hypothetical protein FB559_7994 [Actinoallomurus bryophytorum]|uniref:Uncharacterized protein n=1 Tax=Actinoallomurus bryophytorum TaxID=1490222 RepID=A0A543C0S9_9ACTN|nr:hypothetical protein [Actinoallomurus bryophytorum]TQL90682.1 hypothetical protein FB559_7994 [Actinoallomurus bryophytorum]
MAEVSPFTEGDLREPAGVRSFERGQGYRHAVTGIEITAGRTSPGTTTTGRS